MKQSAFSHVGISCNDPIAQEIFYSKYFGFKRARVYVPGPEQVVMLKSGNIYLELFKATEKSPVAAPSGSGPDYAGWKHICFLVDDLDEKLNELKDVVKITQGPLDMSEFIEGMRVCWVADPEGNIVELNQGYVDETNPPELSE